jgi:ABC-type multidrug transport system ATPase subunit
MARIRGLTDAAAAKAIDVWSQRLYLDRYLDVKLPEVSKGTAQKVGLAQALLSPPDLLVLDEPWEGLDATTREQIPAIIDEVQGQGGAVLVSDHLGEVSRVPGAHQWSIVDGELAAVADAAKERFVVTVEVEADQVNSTVDLLRGVGDVRVRAVSS